jgi:hypothetical protein
MTQTLVSFQKNEESLVSLPGPLRRPPGMTAQTGQNADWLRLGVLSVIAMAIQCRPRRRAAPGRGPRLWFHSKKMKKAWFPFPARCAGRRE